MSAQIGFWLAAGTLTVIALGLVLRPLLGRGRSAAGVVPWEAHQRALARDQIGDLAEQRARGELDEAAHEAALAELVRGLDQAPPAEAPARASAAAPWAGWAVALLVPLTAVLVYLQLGRPHALEPAAQAAGTVADDPRLPHSVSAMIQQLEARLATAPDDPDDWLMLGRTYAAMNRLEDAQAALDQALARRPDHATTLVAQAEVLAGLAGDRLDERSMRLVHRALEVDPRFPRALWLAGVSAFRQGDPRAALGLFERIRAHGTLPQQEARRLDDAIARARQAAGRPAGLAVVAGRQASAQAAGVAVSVRLDARLAGAVAPDDVLFVFARAAEGPKMPLAVARRRAGDLPLDVTLDDTSAMRPELRLSGFEAVVVAARISRSGSATPSTGDITSTAVPARPGWDGRLELVLDRRVP